MSLKNALKQFTVGFLFAIIVVIITRTLEFDEFFVGWFGSMAFTVPYIYI